MGFTAQFKMHLFPVLILGAVVVVTTDQLQCDPERQYEQDGNCCSKCGAGTSWSETSICTKPVCIPCGKGEYQDKDNKETKCKLQPFCDPNLNFEVAVHESKEVRTPCKCKLGFHCTSECSSCVQHTECEPGKGAQHIGNHSSDTKCHDCPEGTFSSVRSWDGICKKWTECEKGYHIQQRGTSKSDNICVQSSRMHIFVISTVCAVLVITLVALMYWRCRENVKDQVKHFFCNDSQREEEKPTHTYVNIPPEIELIIPEPESPTEEVSTQEGYGMTPEENLDEDSQENGKLTENGNFVTQERGKSDILSRQESQTQTFVDSL